MINLYLTPFLWKGEGPKGGGWLNYLLPRPTPLPPFRRKGVKEELTPRRKPT